MPHVVGAGTALKTASATASPGMPSPALKVGDILIMHANVSSGTISISANSTGWVELDHTTTALTNACEGYLWAMRVTSVSMSGPELTRTAGDYMIARIWLIRDAWEGGTVSDAIVGSRFTTSGAGVFTLSHTTFNTTQNDALLFFVGQRGLDATGSDMVSTGLDRAGTSLDWVAPYQNEGADGTTTGNGGGYAVCFGYKAIAGATGQQDWSHGSASGWIKQAIAIRGRGRDEVAPSRIESAEIVYAPNLNPDLYTIRPARIESAEAVYGGDVVQDLHTVRPPRIESAEVVYGGSVGDPPDTTAPTASLVAPADAALREETTITVDLEDENRLAFTGILATFPDGTADVVYDGFDFGPHYQGNANTYTEISTKKRRFTVRRDDGWTQAPTFYPIVVDRGGNVAEGA